MGFKVGGTEIIDSSGNVASTVGNIDGRDIAADGTKLDTVATNANNYTHPNHSGEVTSTADGATVIADDVVDEANLKVSNTPTDGYFLSAQSGNTGGLTWANPPAGYADSDVDTHLNQSSASSGQYLQWNGSDYAWAAVAAGYANSDVDAHLLTSGVTLDATNDRVGIGTAAPLRQLHISNTSANSEIAFTAGTSGTSSLLFGDGLTGTDVYKGYVQYQHNGDYMTLAADGADVLRCDSGGVDVYGELTTTSNVGCSGNGSFGSTNSSGYRLLYYSGGMYAGSDINLQANISGSNASITCYGLTVYGYFNNYSDDRLKNKIGNISTPLDKISTLNGFYYTDSESVTDLKKAENLQDPSDTHHKKESQQKVGLSAQEVKAVLPEVVKTSKAADSETDTEYLTLDYTRVIPLLVEGIKELKTKVETLETENTAIKARLDALEG